MRIATILSLVLTLAGVAVAQVCPAEKLMLSAESKSALGEEAGGKVLVTDLSAPHEGSWFIGTMIGAVNDWVKLPAGRYIVRCRVAVDQAGAANVSLWDEVYASTPEQGQFRLGWGRWMGVDFVKAGEYQNLDTVVDLPVAMSIQPRLFWRRSTKEPGDIKQIKLASVEILPAAQPLVISDVLANKVHYREGEAGNGYAKVLNCTDQAQTGKLVVRLLTDLETAGAVIYNQPITVPARCEQQVNVTFPKLGKYGYELRAEILDARGKRLDARADYFTVLNNVLEVGMSAGTPFRETYIPYPMEHFVGGAEEENWNRALAKTMEAMRRRYNNTMELFAWGPADCIKLTPASENWESGQTKYPGSVTRTKRFIAENHKHGMTVQLYIQSLYGCGDGGQYFQEHPEEYAYNADGKPQGFDITRPQPVDDHIAGLLQSIATFGWDGARWDGHFDFCAPYNELKTLFGEKIDTTKRDLLVAGINDRIRKAIRAKYPLFTWGHNWNDQVENFVSSQEMRSICANGAWVMNEVIKDSENPTSGTYQWVQYANRINSGNRLVRAKGGFQLLVAPPQYFAAGSQVLYKALLPFAGRAYLYGGPFFDRMPMDIDLAAFVTRYARYIRGVEFKEVADASKLANVTSTREIWWKEYLVQKVTPERVEQVLGLVNPPAAPAVTNDPSGALPPVQRNITVTFTVPTGMKSAKATLLAPDHQPFQQALPVKLAGGKATVVVPELRYWDLIHLDWSK